MDFYTVSKKLKNDEYKNMDPYPYPPNISVHNYSKEEYKELLKVWRAKNSKLESEFINDLTASFIDVGLNEKVAALATNYCWEEGHSSGLYAVLNHTNEILPMLEASKGSL